MELCTQKLAPWNQSVPEDHLSSQALPLKPCSQHHSRLHGTSECFRIQHAGCKMMNASNQSSSGIQLIVWELSLFRQFCFIILASKGRCKGPLFVGGANYSKPHQLQAALVDEPQTAKQSCNSFSLVAWLIWASGECHRGRSVDKYHSKWLVNFAAAKYHFLD